MSSRLPIIDLTTQVDFGFDSTDDGKYCSEWDYGAHHESDSEDDEKDIIDYPIPSVPVPEQYQFECSICLREGVKDGITDMAFFACCCSMRTLSV